MKKQTLNFIDSICIAQPVDKGLRDNALKMMDNSDKVALRTQIDATSSGVLTNMRVYPGVKVSKGFKTFFSKMKGGDAEYDKPVLKHHDGGSDPIGRVVGATYTKYKSGKDFDEDYSNPDPMGGKGSGVVTVEALITDPDSIRKILDGRFLSVSAGHSTDAAYCSVCGDSVLTCVHIPGKRYDNEGDPTTNDEGSLCYVITNDMTYNEVSFVKMPAQPTAKLINYNWADCKDNKNTNIVIDSISTGAKDLVRVFNLVDSNDEINLLTGRKKSDSKKTTVAVKPTTADKLKAALSIPTVQSDDDVSIRQEDKGSKVEPSESDLKAKPPTKQEGNIMDATKLQELVDSLQKDLTAAKTKITEHETVIAAKDTEIKKLSEDSKKLVEDAKVLESKMKKTLATSLASLKIRLKKPDAQNLDTAEKKTQFIDKLASRSVASLEDAVVDLMEELENVKEVTKQDKAPTAAELLDNADKVTDPTIKQGSTSKSNQKLTTSVDLLDRELGV